MVLVLALLVFAWPHSSSALTCSGYEAKNVTKTASGLVADLQLSGPPCNPFGSPDITNLKLTVEYQTETRLRVLIEDADQQAYQVQEEILPRQPVREVVAKDSLLQFDFTDKPFSFKVLRGLAVLFDTSSLGESYESESSLIFASQYICLRTRLANNANVYGLGEHSDSFRLPLHNYTRTLWNSEAPFIPQNQNLYGSHPVYFDNRGRQGTHGVFLLSSSGMDIKINQTIDGAQYLEYNTLGGVLDFYFLAGPDPAAVSQQYAEVVGLPAMTPYWSLGFHQCKYGWDSIDVMNEVVANYSSSGIPLEAIWGDINYMDEHKDFTSDPKRFALAKFQTLARNLHNKNQRLVTILDPGIKIPDAHEPEYSTFTRGASQKVFFPNRDGNGYYTGQQWPGRVVWPDWFAPNTQSWWTNEINLFFDPSTGIDIDGLWNDMNEASNMCTWSNFTANCDERHTSIPAYNSSFHGPKKGLPDRNLFQPGYRIANHQGEISSNTLFTNITNHDKTYQYDTHNLYGTMMARASYNALLARRPNKRPFVLTRSNFAGAGKYAAHWFGDNASTWHDYRASIRQLLAYASMHVMPMVGSDVCGFNKNAEEHMCAQWALLGAFQPFYRNHADTTAPPQEFYRWELVRQAAKKAIDARYRLLDYMYTALWRASKNKGLMVQPLWFLWSGDEETWGIDTQWVLGDAILVSPVVDETQRVRYYLPPGKASTSRFYDFWTGRQVEAPQGGWKTEENVAWTDIPVHFIGGNIVPMRTESGMTTTEVRSKNFTVFVAPDAEEKARGWLYLDDGESLDVGGNYSEIEFTWDGKAGVFEAKGLFGYKTDVVVESIVILGEKGGMGINGTWGLQEGFTVQIE
ncbi:putative alpha/beta-glucosidase agdC [Naviculisporaceae sp. PSN 640]